MSCEDNVWVGHSGDGDWHQDLCRKLCTEPHHCILEFMCCAKLNGPTTCMIMGALLGIA